MAGRLNDFVTIRSGILPKNEYNLKKHDSVDSYEVSLCRDFLQRFATRCSIDRETFNSYNLKHRVEDHFDYHVSNGAMIQAADEMGFQLKPVDKGPNVIIGLLLHTSDLAWKNIKPTGFSKWLFARYGEDSNIGDLAEQALYDPDWPRRAKKFMDFWRYLRDAGRRSDVIESFRDAWRQYSGAEPPAPTYDILDDCIDFYERSRDIETIGPDNHFPSAPDDFTYVYVLFEEDMTLNRRVARYVGLTKDPANRLNQHVIAPNSKDKTIWTGMLLQNGQEPLMAILRMVPNDQALTMESSYIQAFLEYEETGLLNRNKV